MIKGMKGNKTKGSQSKRDRALAFKAVILVLIIGFVLFATSIFYYFVLFLPKQEQSMQELARLELELKVRNARAETEIRKDCTKFAIESSGVSNTNGMPLDPKKVDQFRSAMLQKGYSLKKIDEFLTLKTKTYGEGSMIKRERFEFDYEVCLHGKGLK